MLLSVGDKNAFAGIYTLSEYFPSSLGYYILEIAQQSVKMDRNCDDPHILVVRRRPTVITDGSAACCLQSAAAAASIT